MKRTLSRLSGWVILILGSYGMIIAVTKGRIPDSNPMVALIAGQPVLAFLVGVAMFIYGCSLAVNRIKPPGDVR